MVYSIVHDVRGGASRGAATGAISGVGTGALGASERWSRGQAGSRGAPGGKPEAGDAGPGGAVRYSGGVARGAGGRGARGAAARVDLRRRETRELSELIASRAEWLLPVDRDLVSAVFGRGLTTAQAATLTGVSTRVARRRVSALATRVLSAEFEAVVGLRGSWPSTRRRVATACVLEGRTLRETAAHLRLSLHTVRTQMDVVRALLDEGETR